ncbi:MAG: hypothetical protein GY801_09205 [bacterium]|nr:hypothetical protein [bacterium]
MTAKLRFSGNSRNKECQSSALASGDASSEPDRRAVVQAQWTHRQRQPAKAERWHSFLITGITKEPKLNGQT